jgi:hypothetical protein
LAGRCFTDREVWRSMVVAVMEAVKRNILEQQVGPELQPCLDPEENRTWWTWWWRFLEDIEFSEKLDRDRIVAAEISSIFTQTWGYLCLFICGASRWFSPRSQGTGRKLRTQRMEELESSNLKQ